VKRLALDSVGVLDSTLPRALSPTLYEHVRDMAFLVLALSFLAIAAILTLIGGRRGSRA
jgi:apolipoprotein N-acyltransferase